MPAKIETIREYFPGSGVSSHLSEFVFLELQNPVDVGPSFG
jgi:hypothetical protein